MAERRVARFLLFTAPARGERKMYVASFRTIDDAIASGEKATSGAAYWQVVDKFSSGVVAEDMAHLG
jgi:hypothetical protein